MSPPIDLNAVRKRALAIEQTGMVSCPNRIGACLARNRCVQFQRERVCGCPTGAAALVAYRAWQRDQREMEKRLSAAREMYKHTAHPPWRLKCKNRTCQLPGKWFIAERGFHRKPDYCGPECSAAAEARARKRRARLKARLELMAP